MQNNHLPNLALLSPYDSLTSKVRQAASGLFNLHDFRVVDIDHACEIASGLDPEYYDIVMSRGATAEHIREVAPIPVVRVFNLSSDLLHTLLPHRESTRRAAFFNYLTPLPGLGDVETALNMRIEEHLFDNLQDVAHMVAGFEPAGHDPGGYDLIVGGGPVMPIVAKHGFKGALIENGAASIEMAMREARDIVEARQRLRRDLARMEAVVSSIAEGVIVSDEDNRVIIMNPAAQRIMNISEATALGSQVDQVIPHTRIREVLASRSAELSQLQDVGNTTVVTSRVPILVGERCIGVVCSFSDVPQIQKAERNIRRKMQSKGFNSRYTFGDLLTACPRMQSLKKLAGVYAKTDSTVLIYGESGTGKELFAQSIHAASARSAGPFVAINCAAIPENLLESELFGYEGGAFTGAKREGKEGLIEISHQGTLFLDEIGDFPMSLQSRLLRVLQERELMRVGGKDVIPVDIRIIGATNLNLRRMAAEGRFRKDLFYRLNVLPLDIPPLRERPEDIPLLAATFMSNGVGNERNVEKCRAFLAEFAHHDWPGNIRELKAVIERLSLISGSFPTLPWLEILHLTEFKQRNDDTPAASGNVLTRDPDILLGDDLRQMVRTVETRVARHFMREYGNDREKVAERLGISRMSLWRKLNPQAESD